MKKRESTKSEDVTIPSEIGKEDAAKRVETYCRRKAEEQRKAKIKEDKALKRCHYIAGEIICKIFPQLYSTTPKYDSSEFNKLRAVASFLASHEEELQHLLDAIC